MAGSKVKRMAVRPDVPKDECSCGQTVGCTCVQTSGTLVWPSGHTYQRWDAQPVRQIGDQATIEIINGFISRLYNCKNN